AILNPRSCQTVNISSTSILRTIRPAPFPTTTIVRFRRARIPYRSRSALAKSIRTTTNGREPSGVPVSADAPWQRRHAVGCANRRCELEAGMVDRRDFVLGAIAASGLPLGASQAGGQARSTASNSPGALHLLVFDTFGTVVDWRSSVIGEGEQLGRAK